MPFLSRTPGPPPSRAMNSTPANLSLARTHSGDSGLDRRSDRAPIVCALQKAMIALSLAPTRRASFAHDQPSNWRTALTCSGVILNFAAFRSPRRKARRNASDAGGNASNLTSAVLPSACDSMSWMASTGTAAARTARQSKHQSACSGLQTGAPIVPPVDLASGFSFPGLPQAHARPFPVLLDEDHAGGFEGDAN